MGNCIKCSTSAVAPSHRLTPLRGSLDGRLPSEDSAATEPPHSTPHPRRIAKVSSSVWSSESSASTLPLEATSTKTSATKAPPREANAAAPLQYPAVRRVLSSHNGKRPDGQIVDDATPLPHGGSGGRQRDGLRSASAISNRSSGPSAGQGSGGEGAVAAAVTRQGAPRRALLHYAEQYRALQPFMKALYRNRRWRLFYTSGPQTEHFLQRCEAVVREELAQWRATLTAAAVLRDGQNMRGLNATYYGRDMQQQLEGDGDEDAVRAALPLVVLIETSLAYPLRPMQQSGDKAEVLVGGGHLGLGIYFEHAFQVDTICRYTASEVFLFLFTTPDVTNTATAKEGGAGVGGRGSSTAATAPLSVPPPPHKSAVTPRDRWPSTGPVGNGESPRRLGSISIASNTSHGNQPPPPPPPRSQVSESCDGVGVTRPHRGVRSAPPAASKRMQASPRPSIAEEGSFSTSSQASCETTDQTTTAAAVAAERGDGFSGYCHLSTADGESASLTSSTVLTGRKNRTSLSSAPAVGHVATKTEQINGQTPLPALRLDQLVPVNTMPIHGRISTEEDLDTASATLVSASTTLVSATSASGAAWREEEDLSSYWQDGFTTRSGQSKGVAAATAAVLPLHQRFLSTSHNRVLSCVSSMGEETIECLSPQLQKDNGVDFNYDITGTEEEESLREKVARLPHRFFAAPPAPKSNLRDASATSLAASTRPNTSVEVFPLRMSSLPSGGAVTSTPSYVNVLCSSSGDLFLWQPAGAAAASGAGVAKAAALPLHGNSPSPVFSAASLLPGRSLVLLNHQATVSLPLSHLFFDGSEGVFDGSDAAKDDGPANTSTSNNPLIVSPSSVSLRSLSGTMISRGTPTSLHGFLAQNANRRSSAGDADGAVVSAAVEKVQICAVSSRSMP